MFGGGDLIEGTGETYWARRLERRGVAGESSIAGWELSDGSCTVGAGDVTVEDRRTLLSGV